MMWAEVINVELPVENMILSAALSAEFWNVYLEDGEQFRCSWKTWILW